MKEEEFETEAGESGDNEKETVEWARKVVEDASEATKEMELPEAAEPVGFKDDVVLRPYQRHALHWCYRERVVITNEKSWKESSPCWRNFQKRPHACSQLSLLPKRTLSARWAPYAYCSPWHSSRAPLMATRIL